MHGVPHMMQYNPCVYVIKRSLVVPQAVHMLAGLDTVAALNLQRCPELLRSPSWCLEDQAHPSGDCLAGDRGWYAL